MLGVLKIQCLASSAYDFGPPIAETAGAYPGVSVTTLGSWKKQDLRLAMKEKRSKTGV